MLLTRRAAIKGLLVTGIGAVTGATTYGVAFERHQIGVTEAALPVSGLPPALDGLRIGLLTDIHHSGMVPADDVTRAVELLLAQRPDLIVLGGDYVTFGDRAFVEPVAELLAPLQAPHGVFAILGNHDDDRDMPAALSRRGIEVLKDARTKLDIRGERLELAGLRFWTRRPQDLARVLRNAAATVILLAHDPRRLTEAAAFDIPAVLSGHTHGGQVVLPGVGAVARRRFPVLEGLGSRENTSIFVSRGIGTVYVPIRINCPPEVAMITPEAALADLTNRRPSTRHPPSRIASTASGYARCSSARIRALSVSGVSPSSTGTVRWITIGPPSSSAVTRCTVTPLTLAPCSSAWRCASTPGNAGSSEGWMLRMAFGNASRSGAPTSRM